MSTCTLRKMGNLGAMEMAQWGMCLMQKPEDLVQISSTDKKDKCGGRLSVMQALGEWRWEYTRGLGSSQLN